MFGSVFMFELRVDERGAWACEEVRVDGVEGWEGEEREMGRDVDDGVVGSVDLLV